MNNESSASAVLRSAVVLGAGGLVGRMLARQLEASGVVVTAVDRQQAPATGDSFAATWLECDVAEFTAAAQEALATADAVFICLPEAVTLAALPEILRMAGETTLIADTLSVKSRLVEPLKALRQTQEYLSFNPMFSPRISIAGQNVAVVPWQTAPRAAAFLRLLEAWGAHLTTVTADEHDRMTALIQVATHAALLSLGLVLKEWRYDIRQCVGLATPPHRVCLAMLARMSDAAAEVYWDIQHSHPYGREVRGTLAQALERLSAVALDENPGAFEQLMGELAHVVQPLRSELLRVADSVSAASSL